MEYLGIPVVLVSSFVLGLTSLRRKLLPPAVSILLLATAPGRVFLTITQLPAMPSGSFSIFSVMILVLGASLATASHPPAGTVSR